jgi:hypothetical protein
LTEPVLVVHGVGNRDAPDFAREVANLNRRTGESWSFVPVYWGDLAAETPGLADAVPGWILPGVRGGTLPSPSRALLADLLAGGGTTSSLTRSAMESWELVADSAVGRGAGAQAFRGSATRGSAGEAEIRAAIAEEWPETKVLKDLHDPTVLAEVGHAISAGLDQTASMAPSLVRGGRTGELRGVVKGILRGIDSALGAVTGAVLGNVNTFLRTRLGPGIGRFLGDIFVYESHRQEIGGRLRKVLDGEGPEWGTKARPVKVIAHSLGGLIAFDAAAGDGPDRLWIDRFVTFGSQSAFFHVLKARDGLAVYRSGAPVLLPPSIGGWTNLWEPLDPLAFLAGKVFRLASGAAPVDFEVPHRESVGLWTHSSYWKDPLLVEQIRKAFA